MEVERASATREITWAGLGWAYLLGLTNFSHIFPLIMDQKESHRQESIAAPQIKTEQGIPATTIKTEPGAVTVKEEPSSISLEDDRRITSLMQEYGRRPPPPTPRRGRRVVRFSAAPRKLLRCPRADCPFMAVRKDTIENHVAFKHDGGTKPFKCKFRRCGKQYCRKTFLTAHQNNMHPKKPRERNNNIAMSATKKTSGLKREIKQEIKREVKHEPELEDFKMGQFENPFFETDGNDELAKRRVESIDAISKCRSALKQQAATTSPLLLKLGPATATTAASTETPKDENGLNEREVKKEAVDSVEGPSTSRLTPNIILPDVSLYASGCDDTIEILSDDTDDDIQIVHENIKTEK